jgi:tetratricopeptide (TPR) repeat protein
VYSSQGRHAEAEALYVQTLESQRRVLGPKHAHTLMSMNNLALTYKDQKRYTEAETMLRETLTLSREVRGDKHPYTLDTGYNLACVMALDGRPKEALAVLRQVVDRGFAGVFIAEDSDLGSLHGDPDFEALVAEVEKRSKAK